MQRVAQLWTNIMASRNLWDATFHKKYNILFTEGICPQIAQVSQVFHMSQMSHIYPKFPKFPRVPNGPCVPNVPCVSNGPYVPNVPSVPNVPCVPIVPCVPNGACVPNVPCVPNVLSVPYVPNVTYVSYKSKALQIRMEIISAIANINHMGSQSHWLTLIIKSIDTTSISYQSLCCGRETSPVLVYKNGDPSSFKISTRRELLDWLMSYSLLCN